MIAKILHALLTGADPRAIAICAQLPVYMDAPAVLTVHLQEDMPYPCVLITGRGDSGETFGCRANRGHAHVADVQVFDNKSTSLKFLSDLADDVHELIERNPLIEAASLGLQCAGCLASVPRDTNDPFGFPAYTIQVKARLLET